MTARLRIIEDYRLLNPASLSTIRARNTGKNRFLRIAIAQILSIQCDFHDGPISHSWEKTRTCAQFVRKSKRKSTTHRTENQQIEVSQMKERSQWTLRKKKSFARRINLKVSKSKFLHHSFSWQKSNLINCDVFKANKALRGSSRLMKRLGEWNGGGPHFCHSGEFEEMLGIAAWRRCRRNCYWCLESAARCWSLIKERGGIAFVEDCCRVDSNVVLASDVELSGVAKHII